MRDPLSTTASTNVQEPLHAPVTARSHWPEQVAVWLPLTLFFPVAWMYTGVVLFYISLLVSGNWQQKWQRLRQHPMLIPILGLSAVTAVVAVLHGKPDGAQQEFWPAFGHYQTYLFLLPFLTLQAGAWQDRALRVFFGGATLAAFLFVLSSLHVLPDVTLFRSYVIYLGNKSILLGMLLAIASGWLLCGLVARQKNSAAQWLQFLFITAVMLLLSKTRTALVIWVLMLLLMMLSRLRWNWRSLLIAALPLLAAIGLWQYALSQPRPPSCVVNTVQAAPWEKVRLRGVCTLQQIRDFSEGRRTGDDDGMRTELYRVTAGLIAEAPWSGHGIGSWMPFYRERAQGLSSATMTTPHSDYLLYLTEAGVLGMLALLLIYAQQARLAWQFSRSAVSDQRRLAMPLAMLTLSMVCGAAFNAILRDGVFAMAFLVLLAVLLAGAKRPA